MTSTIQHVRTASRQRVICHRAIRGVLAVVCLSLLTACAANRAFSLGEHEGRVGNWDAAVEFYTRAVQADPDNPQYKIALERAMLNASRIHYTQAQDYETQDQLDAALAGGVPSLLHCRKLEVHGPVKFSSADHFEGTVTLRT